MKMLAEKETMKTKKKKHFLNQTLLSCPPAQQQTSNYC